MTKDRISRWISSSCHDNGSVEISSESLRNLTDNKYAYNIIRKWKKENPHLTYGYDKEKQAWIIKKRIVEVTAPEIEPQCKRCYDKHCERDCLPADECMSCGYDHCMLQGELECQYKKLGRDMIISLIFLTATLATIAYAITKNY